MPRADGPEAMRRKADYRLKQSRHKPLKLLNAIVIHDSERDLDRNIIFPSSSEVDLRLSGRRLFAASKGNTPRFLN
ncbi:MAG: hypothetical protein ACOY4D_04680 [Pseudomonadota bacterium]